MDELKLVESERQQALLDGQMSERWEKQLTRLKQQRYQASEEKGRLEQFLAEEIKDVERLQSWSLANLYYTLTGQKQERLTKEDEEVLRAKERFELAVAEVNAIDIEMQQITDKLASVRHWKERLHTAETRKETLVRAHSAEVALQLDQLAHQRAAVLRERKEVDEALQAGRSAVAALRRAEEKFESASNWSTYDLLGGGMIATHMKHSRYDDAQGEVQSANSRIRAFQREIADVKELMASTELVSIGDGLKMADYFFDGLIADWLVNGRITDSLEAVRNGKRTISDAISKLESTLRNVDQRLTVLDVRYDDILHEW